MSLHGKTQAPSHPENQNIKLCWYENTVMKNYQGKGKGKFNLKIVWIHSVVSY
jgi:hypothetical protein